MNEFLVGFLIFLPLVLSAVALAVLWRSIVRRALFAVTLSLSLLGLHGIVAPVAVTSVLLGHGGLSDGVSNAAFMHGLWVSSGLVLACGIPFAWWLGRAFREIGPGAAAPAAHQVQ